MTIQSIHLWAVDISAWIDVQSADEVAKLADELLGPGSEAARKVKGYYRVPDKIRSLAGQVLPRILYTSYGVGAWDQLRFSKTPEGRPFLAEPSTSVDYNVTHDGDWVALASCSSANGAKVGVDVMRIALPRYEPSVASFVDCMGIALTKAEREWIVQAVGPELLRPQAGAGLLSRQQQDAPRAPLTAGEQEALSRLFDLWTYKEAVSKNLGKGLGFDFAQIELALWRAVNPATTSDEEATGSRPVWQSAPSILSLSGVPDGRYEFLEVTLPGGRASKSCNRDPHNPCKLVVSHGPTDPPPQVQVHPALPVEEAARSGFLTLWTMDELVAEARSLR